MILPVHDLVRDRITSALRQLYALEGEAVPPIVIDYPPNRELGDLALPLAFELAKRLRKAPKVIAEQLAAALGPIPGIARVEATKGYLNLFLDRATFLRNSIGTKFAGAGEIRPDRISAPGAVKTIVEHTAINPNKAAHIGHLRNSALGDTLVRVLQFRGVPVEVQNYIDDTGVQVADVVVGFRELEKKNLAAVREVADDTRFDYYCWDLYAKVAEWYEADKSRLQHRNDTLHAIEHGGNEVAEIAAFVADRIVRCHLRTMARINVGYDLLAWEGDILRLHFWARAFEILKEKGAVFLQDQGRLAGCWVMPIEEEGEAASAADAAPPPLSGVGHASQPPAGAGRASRSSPGESSASSGPAPQSPSGAGPASRLSPQDADEDDNREKVIVRSNGTVTYVGKDMAYQFWKFGVLGKDFHYRVFARDESGQAVWATSAHATDHDASHPPFGAAGAVFNVIDVRQSYLQKLLKQALSSIGHPDEARRSVHFSYEMVALTHNTARQLGYTLSPEDAARPFVEVSGRKGLGVKADDLLDVLIRKAAEEVVKRNPELAADVVRRIADTIAIAAVRYFMVRFSRGKVIAFDIDEAVNFEGESGPYLQYAVVRATNIFQKLRDREGVTEAAFLSPLRDTPTRELSGESNGHDLWALVLESARLDEVAQQALRTLEFSVLAKYAFGLAQMFNAFYQRYPILNEERDDARRWRAAAVSYFRTQLTTALGLMGISVPPKM
jgi:arginyl-tRNA synthetase